MRTGSWLSSSFEGGDETEQGGVDKTCEDDVSSNVCVFGIGGNGT